MDFMVNNLLGVLIVLIGVAYLIVVERKVLGMLQLRLGPNKVGFKGLAQPIADGVKLFTKEFSMPFSGIMSLYVLGPALCFFMSYCVWVVIPSFMSTIRYDLALLFILCVSSSHVFGVFLCGWNIDSRYSFLGAMRGIAQTISYEVVLSGVLCCPLIFFGGYDIVKLRGSKWMFLVLFSCEALLMWLVVVLAELNRAPFDFVEGESELVAGYTVEYGGSGFALIALAEYGSIFFMSLLTASLFFSGLPVMITELFSNLILMVLTVFFSYIIVGIRGSMPRYRYDLLMLFCWQTLLPLMLSSLLICFMVVLSIN